MDVILNLILSNAQMIGAFMIPFLLMRIADICFGVILAFKDNTLTFDWKKLLNGIGWGIVSAIGIISLGSGVVILPELLDIFQITIVDSEVLGTMINTASIIGVLVTSILTYGKDAYQKMLKVFNMKETDVVKSTRINEEGEEDVRYS